MSNVARNPGRPAHVWQHVTCGNVPRTPWRPRMHGRVGSLFLWWLSPPSSNEGTHPRGRPRCRNLRGPPGSGGGETRVPWGRGTPCDVWGACATRRGRRTTGDGVASRRGRSRRTPGALAARARWQARGGTSRAPPRDVPTVDWLASPPLACGHPRRIPKDTRQDTVARRSDALSRESSELLSKKEFNSQLKLLDFTL